jgi:alpha-beta hydrolase superfamily lysophospholipase
VSRAAAFAFRGRPETGPVRHEARTRDGWLLALYRYAPTEGGHAAPVLLCHGMGSNRFNLDGPGRTSLARFLHRRGYDVWLVELRGAGASRRGLRLVGLPYRVNFEDYAQHDAPAALRLIQRERGGGRVLWVGHSLGGMVAYALLMSPAGDAVAGAVTLASPGMTDVGSPHLDAWVPLRGLLRFAPPRLPSGLLARLGAPFAPFLAAALGPLVREWGWHPDNLDLEVVRFMMRRGVEDLPTSLLREFARWYEARRMSDRYGLFSFTDHLERVRTPMLLMAGSCDGLTPPEDIRRVYERIGSPDKSFFVAGRESGLDHDYSHVDLVLGRHAPDEIFGRVADWLDAHRDRTNAA